MIKKLNINNKKEVEETIRLIYRTFLICNNHDSSIALKNKMKKLFGSKKINEETVKLFIDSDITLISKENGIINGVIRGKKNKISNLFVDIKYQGKSIGNKLIKRYRKEAKKIGANNIVLKPSRYAYNFYIKQGFKAINNGYLIINL